MCLISNCNILDNEGHSAVLQVTYGCKILVPVVDKVS